MVPTYLTTLLIYVNICRRLTGSKPETYHLGFYLAVIGLCDPRDAERSCVHAALADDTIAILGPLLTFSSIASFAYMINLTF